MLPLVALLAAAPAPAPWPTNGAMTDGAPAGWGNKWEGEGKLAVSRDTAVARSAPASLKIETVGGRARGQASQLRDGEAGTVVRFAGYLKTSGSATATAGVMAYTAGWKAIRFTAVGQCRGAGDWRPFAGEATLPPETARFAYVVMVEGEGAAWLDDVAETEAAYTATLDAAKKAGPLPSAAPKHPAPPKAPNAWTAGEGFYPDYPHAWKQFFQSHREQAAKHPDARVVFLGDSITQGWGDAGKAEWEKHFAPLKSLNFGVGGDGTPQILWRLEHGLLDGLKPDLVVLMIGTNNRWRGDATPETLFKGVEACVKRIGEKAPSAKVLLLGVFPTGAKPDHPDRALFRAANSKLATLAGERVSYLDLTPTFLEADGSAAKGAFAGDVLHLTAEGYRRWAEVLEPAVKRLLSE